ncbi:MAG: phosphate signaling complex protein PhoU [Chitinispirillaceae bacterium]|nr:phosphate signaling complex protein PhoU [Chitinispirillaceae bacterium]
MAIHFLKEIDGLKKRTLELSTMVEENVDRAVRAFIEKNEKSAQAVIDSDCRIDTLEIEVEEECLKILALHQPVAVDLRFIIAVLKMNNDFERIGDLAVNIAERALALSRRPPLAATDKLKNMVEKVLSMLDKSLDALVSMDAGLARNVCASDDAVDALYREMYAEVKNGIVSAPEQADDLLQLLSISRHLERIADHATNIAEDVIYMAEGEISRHHRAGEKK